MNWVLLFYFFFGLLVVLLSANQGKIGDMPGVFEMSMIGGGFVWIFTIHLWKESLKKKELGKE